jgi:serine protease AprX
MYSSRGPTWYDGLLKPDLVAPGHDLVSDAAIAGTLYALYPDRQVAASGTLKRFFRLSGTSMSAAVTSGVAALMIEASRKAGGFPSPRTIKSILQYTALPLDGADALTQGRGALNAAGALALVSAMGASPTLEDWLLTQSITPATTIGQNTLAWAQTTVGDDTVWTSTAPGLPSWVQTVVWGNAFGWDDTVVWGNTGWDDTVVWGNSDWTDTVVWGNANWIDTVVWGNTVDWNDTVVWGNTAPWTNP